MVNLKYLRLRAGLTQQELAAKVGVQHPTVSRWESGRQRIECDRLPLLAKVLDCSIDDLFREVQ